MVSSRRATRTDTRQRLLKRLSGGWGLAELRTQLVDCLHRGRGDPWRDGADDPGDGDVRCEGGLRSHGLPTPAGRMLSIAPTAQTTRRLLR